MLVVLMILERSRDIPFQVVIKNAPRERLTNEIGILRHFHNQKYIRRLVDEIRKPQIPSLVLNYMDDKVLNASDTKTLGANNIKHVAKKVLVALEALHSQNYVHTGKKCYECAKLQTCADLAHTDVKPDNILINYTTDGGALRIKDVELSDFGDTCQIDPDEHMKPGSFGSAIGAPIFRIPEVLLNLRWGAPTDIWSFGTTVSLSHLAA